MHLVVDFYNAYKKIASLEENVIFHFFRYIYLLQQKFRIKKVVFAIDGKTYFKSLINSDYKKKKSELHKESFVDILQYYILLIPNYNIIQNDRLEADDVAFCFCRDYNHCVCISEDYDWLYNLIANTNIKIYRGKHTITRDNFQPLFEIGRAHV